MIVRQGENCVHLITQPDHAALSRRIMEHWAPLEGHARRASILHAIGEHDNGWREVDQDPAIDSDGRVIDFVNAAAAVKQSVWPRGVERLAADPLAAALVAQHAITVYDRFRNEREWDAFFAAMEALRDRLRESTGLAQQQLEQDYAYVRLGDLISLTFCTGWKDEQKYDGWRVRLERDAAVVVTPAALDAPEIAISVRAVELRGQPFESEAAFRTALAAAPRLTLSGTLAQVAES